MVPMISGKSPKVAGSNNGPQLVPKTLVPTSCKKLIVVGINEKIIRKGDIYIMLNKDEIKIITILNDNTHFVTKIEL